MTTIFRDPGTLSPLEQWLTTLPGDVSREEAIDQLLRRMSAAERAKLRYKFNALWARPAQRLPTTIDWDTWFIRAGRGFGKTRTGSEGVRKLVNDGRAAHVTIIGPTASDARDVMIEGPESGLLAVHPPEARPTYKSSNRTLEWPNGARGHVRSAEDPDGVRGLNSDLVWGDEPASWRTGSASWDNAMLGNRLGHPHSIITGTPRPLPWLRALEKEDGTVLTTGSTYDNTGNLAPQFIKLVLARYEGTRLGAQELHAQYLDDVEGALWKMSVIEVTRIRAFDPDEPWLSLRAEVLRARTALGLTAVIVPGDRRPWRTLVGVDPPGETAECGIVVATAPRSARAGDDHAVVLDDMSMAGTPEEWAAQAVAAVHKYGAEGIAAEVNQGRDMVRAVIHAIDPTVKVLKVNATQSKVDRAEPVSALYAKGLVHHAGYFGPLEDQMTTWVPDEGKSPDRIDALVHVLTQLVPPIPVGRAYYASPARAARSSNTMPLPLRSRRRGLT